MTLHFPIGGRSVTPKCHGHYARRWLGPESGDKTVTLHFPLGIKVITNCAYLPSNTTRTSHTHGRVNDSLARGSNLCAVYS